MAAQETKKAGNVSEDQSGVLIITVSHLTCFQVHSFLLSIPPRKWPPYFTFYGKMYFNQAKCDDVFNPFSASSCISLNVVVLSWPNL